jgi:TPP-dependent pyruvate/acetoin dehydrogenase alpha subunit
MDLQQAEIELAALGSTAFAIPLGRWAPAIEAAFTAMDSRDWIVPGARARIGAALRGCSPQRLVDPQTGARPYKMAPSSMDPAVRALHAVGIALAVDGPVLCVLGQAAAANGAFYEAMNTAALTGAKAIFLVMHQELAEDAPIGQQSAASPASAAAAMGIGSKQIDLGNGPDAAKAVHKAVQRARELALPFLIQINLEA